ncbi:DUF3800 domain-containing protein [Flavobacterium sp.]|uniref:DUF3800 domain-containing protein n=1 Tax=Flavobacterium sp. TaxID=239 RepID=UPI003B9D151C
MNKAFIFIDEFGNSHLNLSKNGTFSHFIYTSVIVDESFIEKARQVRSEICQRFRLGPDIKSNNIKVKDFDKRLQILEYLIDNLDFHIDVLVVDKSRIGSLGLHDKRTFYKYFQKTFVRKYNDRFDRFSIFADAVGTDFRSELQNFVVTNGIDRDLFNPDRAFELTDDKTGEKLVQLADFVSGCLGKIFCISHSSPRAKEIYERIHQRLSVDYFPYETSQNYYLNTSNTEFDSVIREMNFHSVHKYLDKENHNKQEHFRLLEYLQLQNQIDSLRLVPTSEILAYLQKFYPNYSIEKLRLLVRDLRYDGLLIISHSGKPGYKLASSYQDIYQNFNHFLKYVIPMLQKVQAMNKSLSSNSMNKINPIEKDKNMLQLKELLNAL